ncbi:ribonuclease domain-containing protein [Allorhizocola rhizosphaerae]|uniref:ribonuclease domain-containing protein n=1 Tax=Allorhizocola rhizosphaerae TaxID=1872709 RepID=UPI001FEAF91B|nr:ribonuclease domain-containing protein [Allorhizocola rhizosphaerae]
MERRTRYLLLATALVAFAVAAIAGFVTFSDSPQAPVAQSTPVSGLPTVAVGELPSQAHDTLALIDKGGPYPYQKDGSIFGNNEGLLPKRERGYYREFTVPTPGSRDRGARRLVIGKSGDVYYTADHYESFRQVLR